MSNAARHFRTLLQAASPLHGPARRQRARRLRLAELESLEVRQLLSSTLLITSPVAGAPSVAASPVLITAAVSGDVASRVVFFANNVNVGQDTDGTDGWTCRYLPDPGTVSLTAAAFDAGGNQTGVSPAVNFEASWLRPTEQIGALAPGLEKESYIFTAAPAALPDFDNLQPDSVVAAANFSTAGEPAQNYACRFRGYIQVPADGSYSFTISGGAAAEVSIGNRRLAHSDNGLSATGSIGLKAGLHPITVTMYQAGSGSALAVQFSGPGISQQIIPDAALQRFTGLYWDRSTTTRGGQGGSGAWNSGNFWGWDAASGSYGNRAFTDGSDVIFRSQAGDVSLPGNVTVGSMTFMTPGYRLRTNGKMLTINGQIRGQPFDVREEANKVQAGLTFRSSNTFYGRISGANWYSWPTLRVDGATLTFDGQWNGGYGSVTSYWQLFNGARIVVGPNAQINNNQDNLINARTFAVEGQGNETLEFAPEFAADHTGYPAQWLANGLSPITLTKVTVVTQRDSNLATISKKAFDYTYSHHGLITFGKSGNATWIVRDANQQYDGGINWMGNWTLVTQTDLTATNQYTAQAKVAFGSQGDVGYVLTKQGAGTLNLSGTQGYAPGAGILVQQGTVNFNTNPGDPGSIYPNFQWPSTTYGQNLRLDVRSGGAASFAASASGIYSLESAGNVTLSQGSMDILDHLTLSADSRLSLAAQTTVVVHGDATLGGQLVAQVPANASTTVTLMSVQGAFNGSFARTTIPAGWQLVVTSNSVELVPTVAPPVATDDNYSVVAGQTLSVPANGVLANDTGVENSALTAVLVSGPSHGNLTLNANGSFTYTPTSGYVGSDSFSYKANDGQADSAGATVNLTVRDTQAPTLVTNTGLTVLQGTAGTVIGNTTLKATDNVSAAAGITFTLTSVPADGTLKLSGAALAVNGTFTQADVDAGRLTYDNTANVNGNFTFTVKDASNNTSSPGSCNFTISKLAPPANLVLSAGDGQIRVSWSVVSGASAYRIRYGTSSGSYPSVLDVSSRSSSSTTLTGLTNGTVYYVTLSASNTAGEGLSSAEANATPAASAAADVSPPQAFALVRDPSGPGGTSYRIQVKFTDNRGVRAATLAVPSTILITGPRGFMQAAVLVGATPEGDATSISATYQITPPGGTWDLADVGRYGVALASNTVADLDGNRAPAQEIGCFFYSFNSLFSERYYLSRYRDVAAAVSAGAIASGYAHFQAYGQQEGRSPSALFDEAFYRQEYPDIAAAVARGQLKSGFEHFMLWGAREGRQPSVMFNPQYYLMRYPPSLRSP